MKKKILLIRHSRPDFPDGVRLCLGIRTDIGICGEGREKARRLRDVLFNEIAEAGAIYSSPLKRAVETAQELSGEEVPLMIEDGLKEMDAGEWDGLDFNTIQKRYRELFEERGRDLSIVPTGGEEFPDGSERMRKTLKKIAASSGSGMIIAVSHAGINRAFLSDVTGIPYKDNMTIPQEYTSVNVLLYDMENDIFECIKTGYDIG